MSSPRYMREPAQTERPLTPEIPLLDVEVADGHLDVEIAVVVEDGVGEGEGGDDLGGAVGLGPVVVAAELELDVVGLVEARAISHDVGVAAGATLEVGGGDHAAIGAEGEAARRLGRRDDRCLDRRLGASAGLSAGLSTGLSAGLSAGLSVAPASTTLGVEKPSGPACAGCAPARRGDASITARQRHTETNCTCAQGHRSVSILARRHATPSAGAFAISRQVTRGRRRKPSEREKAAVSRGALRPWRPWRRRALRC
jgi:hypothetical protein